MGRVFMIAPLLLVPVLIYNGLAIICGGDIDATLSSAIFSVPMISGGQWTYTLGDAVLSFSLLMLFFEVVKSTSTRSPSLINHGLSTAVLVLCLIQFLLIGSFATTVFFLIMLMALFDVLSGFTVSVVSARRDFGVGDGVIN